MAFSVVSYLEIYIAPLAQELYRGTCICL